MIIVTGANGFIGSAIVWALNSQNHTDIVCVDTVRLEQRSEPLKKRNFTQFIHTHDLWDFLEKEDVKKNVSWIIHMGACSSTTEMNEEFLWENNTHYTIRLFNWCAEHQKKFIYASSAATYGAGEFGFSDETDSNLLQPLNPYGYSKVAFDRWVKLQTHLPPAWYGLKFFNVYGPNEYHKEFMSSVIYKAFQQIKNTGELGLFKSYRPEYKDGEQMRDFVYIKDITSWILELMQKQPQSDIYNMGFGKARNWLSVAQQAFASMHKEIKIKWIEMPIEMRERYQYFTEATMSKWQKQGMSAPQWSLEDGINDYITHYLQNQDPYL